MSSYLSVDVSHSQENTWHTRDEFFYTIPREPPDRPPPVIDFLVIIRFSHKEHILSVMCRLHHSYRSVESFHHHLHESVVLSVLVRRIIHIGNKSCKSHADVH